MLVCVSVCVSVYVSICVSVWGDRMQVKAPKSQYPTWRVDRFEKSGSTHINMLLSVIRVNTS